MTNVFESQFPPAYIEITKAVNRYIANGDVIFDIGCNNGNLDDVINEKFSNCTIHAVDIDRASLEKIKTDQFKKNKIIVINKDANGLLSNPPVSKVDVVLINATLHEINNPEKREFYLTDFFRKVSNVLKDGGRLIIGDYFYPPALSDESVNAYVEKQMKEIGHADARDKFVPPSMLQEFGRKAGFNIVYTKDIQAVPEIDRRYVVTVFSK